jgi:hypothetical protein
MKATSVQEAVAIVRKAEDEWDSSDSNFSDLVQQPPHMKNIWDGSVTDHLSKYLQMHLKS